MTFATQRLICRWLHLILALPIVGYVYSPFENLPEFAPMVRYVALPVIIVSGLWMWKGHLLVRLVSKRS